MKIGIIGTRGIPNHYGGFEQLAEKLSVGLVGKGHHVIVYNSHKHSYREKEFMGVELVYCYDAESRLGTAGQFVYDFNCVRDAAKKNFDILLFLGYTSSSIWGKMFPKNTVIISNMDGMEWKRNKYNRLTRRFLLYAEKLAVRYSDQLIADSVVVQSYLENKYKKKVQYISYGAEILNGENETLLRAFNVTKHNYFMLMARMEPENNIEMILDGYCKSNMGKKFLVIGNTSNAFGQRMVKRFAANHNIVFAGAVFDAEVLHSLKFFSSQYFHGHSAGGTNPSLLEAMAAKALIAAHNNAFNRAVLQDDAFYFSNVPDVEQLIRSVDPGAAREKKVMNNLEKIRAIYNWPAIIDQYDAFMTNCYNERKR